MKKGFLLSAFIIATVFTNAQDRFFARTYTTNILEKGNIDLEFWHTSRIGHTNQFFHAQDQRMEVEIGLGRNVQTALYFNRFAKRFSTTDNGTQSSEEIGFSNEWKWKVLHESFLTVSTSYRQSLLLLVNPIAFGHFSYFYRIAFSL